MGGRWKKDRPVRAKNTVGGFGNVRLFKRVVILWGRRVGGGGDVRYRKKVDARKIYKEIWPDKIGGMLEDHHRGKMHKQGGEGKIYGTLKPKEARISQGGELADHAWA